MIIKDKIKHLTGRSLINISEQKSRETIKIVILKKQTKLLTNNSNEKK